MNSFSYIEYGLFMFLFIYLFWWEWNLTSGLRTYKQVLYCLSHTFSPFCSGYFEDGGLTSSLSWLASNHDPPNLSSPSN
jgi:hypothetical protein